MTFDEKLASRADLWPPRHDSPTVLYVHEPTPADREVLDTWTRRLRAELAAGAEVRIARSAEEAARLSEIDDAPIAPVRVAWLPPGRDGDRRWRKRDLVNLRRQLGVAARERERGRLHHDHRPQEGADHQQRRERLARVEQIKAHCLLPVTWSPGSDELTPTLMLKRKPIAEKYAEEIEQLYAS
jgi:hypothetical protein